MLLRNKTGKVQKISLPDGRTFTVRPYRTIEVPQGSDYNQEKIIREDVGTSTVSKTKKTTKGDY